MRCESNCEIDSSNFGLKVEICSFRVLDESGRWLMSKLDVVMV